MLKAFFCAFIAIFSFSAKAQNQIDSLISLLNTDLTDAARIEVLNSLASKYFYKDPIKTDSLATLSIQLAEAIKDPKSLAEALRFKGISYAIRGNFEEARSIYQEALRRLDKANIQTGKPDLYYAIGITYTETGQYEPAEDAFSMALKQQRILQDSVGIANSYVGLGNFYKKISQLGKSAIYLDSAAAIYEKLNMLSELNIVRNNQANVFISLDNYPKALEYAQAALSYNEREGLDQKTAINYHTIGAIYGSLEEFDKAEEFYLKSYDLKKSFGMARGMALSLSNLGSMYIRQARYKKAKETFLEVRSIYDSLNMSCNLPYVDLNLGTIQQDSGRRDSAFYHLSKALEHSRTCQLDEVTTESLIRLGQLYILDLRFDEAETALLEALQIGEKNKVLSTQADAANNLYRYYKQLDQPLKAFRFLEISTALQDSLFNKENARKIARIESQYQFDKEKTLLNEEYEKERLRQKAEVEKQILIRDTAIIIASLLLALVIGTAIFYVKLKRQKQLLALRNEEITEQKQKLEQLNETNDKLLSLLSHDLRSPLHGMQSLMMLWKDEYLTPEELEQIATDVEIRIDNLLQFLDNILSWSKNKFSQLEARKETLQLNRVLDETILLLKPNADLKDITIHFSHSQEHELLGDEVMLKIIFRNILSNAIKFSHVSGTIDVSVYREGDAMKIAFTDYGIGMTEDVQKRLFEKAMHSKEGTTNEMGAGIGLFLSHDFVKLHGGDIEAMTGEGKGATFVVCLPYRRTE